MRNQFSILILLCIICFAFCEIEQQYDEQLAKSFMHYAATAGCGSSRIQDWSCSVCSYNKNVTDITIYSSDKFQTQAYTAYSQADNQIVVAFRGSVNTRNYISDFSFTLVKYPQCHTKQDNCRAHLGFLNAYKGFNNQTLQDTLKLKSKYPTASIVITGHSMGAAVAIFAALELKNYVHVDYIYNFGQPRVGNKAFAEYIMNQLPQIKRVVHDKDIVPHLPPRFLGFHHESQEIWYNANFTSYKECNSSGEDPKCMDSVIIPSISQHTFYLNVTMEAC
ncbi:hypothetical protein ABPG74_016194 [Tetrahymena malaccensis]